MGFFPETMYLLLQPFAMFMAAICFRLSFKPPTAPLNSKDSYLGNAFERNQRAVMSFHRNYTFTLFVIDGVVHLLLFFMPQRQSGYPDFLRHLCPTPQVVPRMSQTITPSFILGSVILLIGTALRLRSFKTLGRSFTFEVSLKPSATHALVTSGPYSYVRHPSYAAALVAHVGAVVLAFAANGWVRRCGIISKPLGLGLILMWMCSLIVVSYNAWIRTGVEDRILKEKFGIDWVKYAHEVPYKLIPGLY